MPGSPPNRFKRQTIFIAWLALISVIIGGRQLVMAREYATDGLEASGQVLAARQTRRWPAEYWSKIYFVDEWGREYVLGLSHGGPALARGQVTALKYLPRSPQTTAILAKDSQPAWWAWLIVATGVAGLMFLAFQLFSRPRSRV